MKKKTEKKDRGTGTNFFLKELSPTLSSKKKRPEFIKSIV